MTNREHLAVALGFSEYEDKDVADIISDSLMEITDEESTIRQNCLKHGHQWCAVKTANTGEHERLTDMVSAAYGERALKKMPFAALA